MASWLPSPVKGTGAEGKTPETESGVPCRPCVPDRENEVNGCYYDYARARTHAREPVREARGFRKHGSADPWLKGVAGSVAAGPRASAAAPTQRAKGLARWHCRWCRLPVGSLEGEDHGNYHGKLARH